MRCLDSYAFVKQIHPATDLQILMHPVSITYNFQPRKTTYKGSSAAESELKRL